MRTSHHFITTLYYLDRAAVKQGWAMAHVVLCWLVTAQPSFQLTLTHMVQKRTDKNCANVEEREEENFLDKIKEVLRGRFGFLECVCVCVFVCVCGWPLCMYVWLLCMYFWLLCMYVCMYVCVSGLNKCT